MCFTRANHNSQKFLSPFCHVRKNFVSFTVSYVDLQRRFKPVDTLPQLKGPLCTTISPDTLCNVNEEVHKVGTSSRSSRGAYVKVASEQQAKYCNTCPCMATQQLFADFPKSWALLSRRTVFARGRQNARWKFSGSAKRAKLIFQ